MNVVFVNPNVCGGRGAERWSLIKNSLDFSYLPVFIQDNKLNIREYYDSGCRNFISAGGDGSVNYLVNELINLFNPDELETIKLGAIGLGSSNDFHKPFKDTLSINGIPVRIDFTKACLRDVGCISYKINEKLCRKYFIINASLGITAEANNLFNNPDKLLTILKKNSVTLAILYSALKTIFQHENLHIRISSAEGLDLSTSLTNIGIIKNPHFSGDLKYDTDAVYNNGLLDVFLAENMNIPESVHLLHLLSRGEFRKVKKGKSWRTEKLQISSDKDFILEYDGEIIITDNAEFSTLSKYLKVC